MPRGGGVTLGNDFRDVTAPLAPPSHLAGSCRAGGPGWRYAFALLFGAAGRAPLVFSHWLAAGPGGGGEAAPGSARVPGRAQGFLIRERVGAASGADRRGARGLVAAPSAAPFLPPPRAPPLLLRSRGGARSRPAPFFRTAASSAAALSLNTRKKKKNGFRKKVCKINGKKTRKSATQKVVGNL